MHELSTPRLIARRLSNGWMLLLSIFLGILVATSLVAGAPVYLRALERLGVDTAIERSSASFLNLHIFAPLVPLSPDGLPKIEGSLEDTFKDALGDAYTGKRQFIQGDAYLVGTSRRPLPAPDATSVAASRGFFQYLSELKDHVIFVDGRMAESMVSVGPSGPVVEAVASVQTVNRFDLQVGDEVVLTPFLGHETRMTARIVGILRATDPTEDYWRNNANVFLDPVPVQERPEPGVSTNPDEPPVALFVTRSVMVDVVGGTYPSTLVKSTWFLFLDKDVLKQWSIADTRGRLARIDAEATRLLPGSVTLTGLRKLLTDFERRSFFSSLPLVLLLTLMVVTVLYYLAMMVSYMVQSREEDVALLRTRGVSDLHLLRLYGLEGLTLTVIAVVLAPFIAMGAIAVSGKLPYFSPITGGTLLTVDLNWIPFAVAAGVGLLCLAIFVIPSVFGARSGLIVHKLRSSRPPTVPLFQRYYLDIGILALGALVFWEMYSRGQLVSGGLFSDVQVNEAFLLAPVLFLLAVALLFMRLFPLVVRFVSGESATLLDLLFAAAALFTVSVIVTDEVGDSHRLAWLYPVAVVAAIVAAYWVTSRATDWRRRLIRYAVQAAAIAWFLILKPPVPGDTLFVPSLGLACLIPAQILYRALASSAHLAPVWVSMGLWRMARNPLQYSWLVLLLVLVTGLGILATTVGGTLDQSHRERILYETGADIRISGIFTGRNVGLRGYKERYLTIPGVTSVSLALRSSGTVGTTAAGRPFRLLGVETRDFPYISWYRDDFSSSSLVGVMRALQSPVADTSIELPEDATQVGVWIKPVEDYSHMFLWMVLEDSRGILSTITLGEIGPPLWHRVTADLPRRSQSPFKLVSVQVYEPGFGAVGTVGGILLDDIHVTAGPDGEEVVVEDFESRMRWLPLETSSISRDTVARTKDDAFRGSTAGVFIFGKETDSGIRGFYRSPTGGTLPVVASSTFVVANGRGVGDAFLIKLESRLVPVVIRDIVDYFPTLSPAGGGFLVADLQSTLKHVNLLSPGAPMIPNELLVSHAPGAGQTVQDAVNQVLSRAGSFQVFEREGALEAIRLDPLITAGWKAMVLLSLAIIVFTAGFGYVTYLLSVVGRNRVELGFLQTMGLSRGQMTGLLALEHVMIVVFGLGLGTWAGFQMSSLMVSSVAVTERGREVLPPFVLITDWSFMLPIYVALFAIFGTAFLLLNRSLRNLNLHTVVRADG